MQNPQIDQHRINLRGPGSRLTACLAAALGLGAVESVCAFTTYVNTCLDLGTSSKGVIALRYAVVHAGEGDTIDLSALNCSLITLNSAEIPIALNNLTIQASSSHAVTIDAAHASRVFKHSGTGTAAFRYVTIQNGNGNYGPMGGDRNYGGCVYSKGNVRLEHATVQGCTALRGGGIFTQYYTGLKNSVVTGNVVSNIQGYIAEAGGALVGGGLYVSYSSVSNNQSQGPVGGLQALGSSVVIRSTISGNVSGTICSAIEAHSGLNLTYSSVESNIGSPGFGNPAYSAVCIVSSPTGGNYRLFITYTTIAANTGSGVSVIAQAGAAADDLYVSSSTISGNTFSGINCVGCSLTLYTSTVAFNSGIGVNVSGVPGGASGYARLRSSIIANNLSDLEINSGASIDSSRSHYNLIVNANILPGDSLRTDPRLAPLAFRGGPTRTHALGIASPAVDSGGTSVWTYDQRGSGFLRSVGVAVDIGAYERQADDDELFGSGFE